MSFYNTCPHCGANLDPGERCDCEEIQIENERAIVKMIAIGKNGQYEFSFKEEEVFEERAV